MSIFKSSGAAFAMAVPPHPAWTRAVGLMPSAPCCTHLSWCRQQCSAVPKPGPRKVEAAARQQPWPLALQAAHACLCWEVLTRLALPKHKAELEPQRRIFILENTWVWPFGTCCKEANTVGPWKVSLKGRWWEQLCSARIHVSCQVYKIPLQHTREWFHRYSNKPSLLNSLTKNCNYYPCVHLCRVVFTSTTEGSHTVISNN